MKVSDLAQKANLPYEGDGALEVTRIRGLAQAGPDHLSFITHPKGAAQALQSDARVLVAPPGVSLPGKTVLRAENPRLAIVTLTPLLHPPHTPLPGIHPSAVVDPGASVDPTASIGPCVVVEHGAAVGPGTILMAGVFLGQGAAIGYGCLIHPNVTIGWDCRVGDRVIIHAGTVLGSDGYGYLQQDGRHLKIPQVGIVVVEDDVEIGACNTIDRAAYDITRIGKGTKTDNLVHIAHNVVVGEHSLLLGQVGIAGSTILGPGFVISGQSGVADHITAPEKVTVGPKSLLTRNPKSGEVYYGYPARPVKDWQKSVAHFNSLGKLVEKINALAASLNRKKTD
ncbi:MAG: UDP-3-O-(3-hydroxymyristoyl)glucosamine N-acyltransferase [Deltaproteobacteria bacterium]|nr:UDP-3-O-(3-hydroxymyristoyl)glucosamine N-acyltransferase [Deltaproteobacteria bacterium]